MSWIYYIRKHVLDLTQGQLAKEILINQTTVSRSEQNPENLPRAAFINLIDLVSETTGKKLPAIWFFDAPEKDVLDNFFNIEVA